MPGPSSEPFQRIPTLSDPSHPTRATDHPPLRVLYRISTDRTEALGANTVAGSMYAIHISLCTIIHIDSHKRNMYRGDVLIARRDERLFLNSSASCPSSVCAESS